MGDKSESPYPINDRIISNYQGLICCRLIAFTFTGTWRTLPRHMTDLIITSERTYSKLQNYLRAIRGTYIYNIVCVYIPNLDEFANVSSHDPLRTGPRISIQSRTLRIVWLVVSVAYRLMSTEHFNHIQDPKMASTSPVTHF